MTTGVTSQASEITRMRKLEATRGGATAADLTITGSAADLALLVYGRSDLRALAESGAVRMAGDMALAERFAQIFPRP